MNDWFERVARQLNELGEDDLRRAAFYVANIPPELGDPVMIKTLQVPVRPEPLMEDRIVIDFVRRKGGPDRGLRNSLENWTVSLKDLRTKLALTAAGARLFLVLCEEDGTPRYYVRGLKENLKDPAFFQERGPADGWLSKGYLLPAGQLADERPQHVARCNFDFDLAG